MKYVYVLLFQPPAVYRAILMTSTFALIKICQKQKANGLKSTTRVSHHYILVLILHVISSTCYHSSCLHERLSICVCHWTPTTAFVGHRHVPTRVTGIKLQNWKMADRKMPDYTNTVSHYASSNIFC